MLINLRLRQRGAVAVPGQGANAARLTAGAKLRLVRATL